MLHITNGDSAGGLLQSTGLINNPDQSLVLWRDVLEEGPTPAELTLTDMTQVRSEFIASRNWGTTEEARDSFTQRNQQITRFRDHAEVIW